MNTVIYMSFLLCVSLAFASALPAVEPKEETEVDIPVAISPSGDESLEGQESRGWGYGGYGRGWGHGGGWGGGYGGGWGRRGGWGGRGWGGRGYGGGWGGGYGGGYGWGR